MSSSEEEVILIADLVCSSWITIYILRRFSYITNRFRRVPTAPGLMTPREWRVQSLIGLLQKGNRWPHTSLEMSSPAVVLIMTALELSYVPQVSIGITWSEYLFTMCFVTYLTCTWLPALVPSLQIAKFKYPETNGRFFCTLITVMILKIRGTVSSAVASSYR